VLIGIGLIALGGSILLPSTKRAAGQCRGDSPPQRRNARPPPRPKPTPRRRNPRRHQ
jgi:hypothetical protein